MAENLDLIHRNKKAIPGKIYYDSKGRAFIGTDDRRLKPYAEASQIVFDQTSNVNTVLKELLNNTPTVTNNTTGTGNTYFPGGWG